MLPEDSRQDSAEFLLLDHQGLVCIPQRKIWDGIDDIGQSVITG